MRRILGIAGDLFWSAVMVVIALVVAVFILRTLKARVPVAAPVVNAIENAASIS